MHYRGDPQATMSTAEVMTTALVAAQWYKNCLAKARRALQEEGYIPAMLSESRLNRRLYAIPEGLWLGLFYVLAAAHQALNPTQEYSVDSFPLPVCDNYRIRHCRLYQGKAFHSKIASKCRYFYGLRVHLIVTATGQPVDIVLAPGADADVTVLRRFHLDLPEGATLYADRGYTDYLCEDVLNQDTAITLTALRRRNSRRPMDGCIRFICHHVRKRSETAFSQIADRFARRIYAVTPRGIELKAFLAVLAFSICG
jgi:IS5 family transposase